MQRALNYFWSQPAPTPSATEANKKREAIHNTLTYGQYAALAYAGYLLVIEGRLFSSVMTAAMGTYLEKITAAFYDKIMRDPETAKYISERYSSISHSSSLFNPIVQPVLAKAVELISVPQASK